MARLRPTAHVAAVPTATVPPCRLLDPGVLKESP
ncbi:hypothetical protein J2S66_003695 [Saccharothrix longispora]|uniref:Uncharacterized protein n=1 Tax=Saccharothrix longispora TaxID=33920 RepID=A0ABU1PXY8_9PSEU|nr:hypothetical protein [Saccharothrix longispora]